MIYSYILFESNERLKRQRGIFRYTLVYKKVVLAKNFKEVLVQAQKITKV